jgi:hypothetical protein
MNTKLILYIAAAVLIGSAAGVWYAGYSGKVS